MLNTMSNKDIDITGLEMQTLAEKNAEQVSFSERSRLILELKRSFQNELKKINTFIFTATYESKSTYVWKTRCCL